MVSKPQIVFEGKAQAESKAQHTRRPWDTRWGFETISDLFLPRNTMMLVDYQFRQVPLIVFSDHIDHNQPF